MAGGALSRFGAWLRTGSDAGPDEVVRVSLGEDIPRARAIIQACQDEGLNVQPEYSATGAYAVLSQDQRMLVMGHDLAAARTIIADFEP
jgi:hypothetical protein